MQQSLLPHLRIMLFASWFTVSIYSLAEPLQFGSDIMLEVFLVPQRGEYSCEKLPENAAMIGREKANQIHALEGMLFKILNRNLVSSESMIFARAIDPYSRVIHAIACDDQLNRHTQELHLYLKPV